MELLQDIQSAFRRGEYRFTVHGLHESTADEISVDDIRHAIISEGTAVVEDYPDDSRGASCLILCWTAGATPLHVVVSHPPDVAVITVYRPDPAKWDDSRRRRLR